MNFTVNYADVEGTGTTGVKYIVMVYDYKNPDYASCQKTAEITIKPFDPPTFTVTGGDAYCEGFESTITPVKVTLTSGSEPFTFVYAENGEEADEIESDETEAELPIPDETTEFQVLALVDGNGCEAVNLNSTSTITINPKPDVEVDAVDPVCAGTAITLHATDIPGADYLWTGPNSFRKTDQSPVITSTTANMSGTYTVTVTTGDGCSNTASTDVTIYPIPNKPTLNSNSPICAGGDLSITATAPTNVPNNPTYEWAWTGPNSYASTTQNVSISEATVDAAGTYSVTATANGCTSEAATLTYTINAIPDAPSVNSPSFCVGGDVVPLQATGTGIMKWYSTETSNDASATAPTLTNTTAATTNYYVSQTVNDCESKRAMATVVVRDTLAPTITATPGFELCAKDQIDLKVDGTFDQTTWSGAAASSLDVTTQAATTYTAPEVTEVKQYKVKVTVSASGCFGSNEATITVNPIPQVTLGTLTDQCLSDKTQQTLTATVTPNANGTGTWGGPVTKKSGSETVATYVPNEAGVSGNTPHTITYDFESDKGCKAEQKSTTVTVFDMPTIGMTLSNNSVCVSGKNSDEVTVRTTGTDANGTFSYSVSNGGTVNATTGAFNPTANSDGDYTITLIYADGNGCKDTTSADLTVHALPIVEITSANPTELCYNGG